LSESQAGYAGVDFSAQKVAAVALEEGLRSEERALKAQAQALQQLQPQALQQLQPQALQQLQPQALQQLQPPALQQLQPQASTLSAFTCTAVPPHARSKKPPDDPELALREDQLAKERALKVLTLLALLVQRYKY
jgi:hypothetical protein